MNTFVITFFAIVATVLSVSMDAERYPAGVDPALCPDYPICDNSLLHGTETLPLPLPLPLPALPEVLDMPEMPAMPEMLDMPETPAVNPAFVFPSYTATMWPEGVHPSACPNYPFCNSVSKIVVPLPGFMQRLYPPGVHPAACPNYPEC